MQSCGGGVSPTVGQTNIINIIVAGENPLSEAGIKADKDYIKNN